MAVTRRPMRSPRLVTAAQCVVTLRGADGWIKMRPPLSAFWNASETVIGPSPAESYAIRCCDRHKG